MCKSDLHAKIGKKSREEEHKVYVGLIDMEKVYDRVGFENV